MDTAKHKKLERSAGVARGHVSVDSRGRNVWQWDDSQLDSTSIMLRSLDNDSLALEPTRKLRRVESSKSAGPARRKDDPLSLQIEQTFNIKLGGGCDPYNRS
jgi:hypothetical protein